MSWVSTVKMSTSLLSGAGSNLSPSWVWHATYFTWLSLLLSSSKSVLSSKTGHCLSWMSLIRFFVAKHIPGKASKVKIRKSNDLLPWSFNCWYPSGEMKCQFSAYMLNDSLLNQPTSFQKCMVPWMGVWLVTSHMYPSWIPMPSAGLSSLPHTIKMFSTPHSKNL